MALQLCQLSNIANLVYPYAGTVGVALMPIFVAYLRATARQFVTLDRQRQHIAAILPAPQWICEAEFVETSEGGCDRPELKKAIAACGKLRATLAIARLDDSMRNDRFLSALHRADVDIAVCDVPDADLPESRSAKAPPRSTARTAAKADAG
jgi:hypothetical protein